MLAQSLLTNKMMVYILLFAVYSLFSLETTQVLPKGIRSIMLKQGVIGGIANKYGNDGNLYDLDGRYSKTFDAEELLKLHPRAPELINGLNQSLPQMYNLGDKLNLGELRFKGDAEVNYSAPVIAYGLTNNWTLALAVPFAKLDANISLEEAGDNNTEEIYNALSASGGLLRPEDEAQLKELMNIDLKQAFYDHLDSKGFKSIHSDNSWELGDVQLVSKYLYYEKDDWTFLNRLLLNFPTGPKDDPNNLVDIPHFHRSFIEFAQVQDYRLDSKNYIGSALTYVWNIADRADKRVPAFEGDVLPSQDRLEQVERNIGDAIRWELNWRTQWNEGFSTAFAYVGQKKEEDYYAGNRSYNYSLLSQNTETLSHTAEVNLTYSAVEKFLDKRANLPYMAGYKYSDMFSAKNMEQQKIHELTFMVFF